MMEQSIELLLRGTQFKKMIEDQIQIVKKHHNLSSMEVEVMFFLMRSGERNTSKDILKVIQVNKGYISQTIDRLNRDGYVEAVHDKKDRRYVHYFLTEKAKEVTDEMAAIWSHIDSVIFNGMTPEELQILRKFADQIELNIARIQEESK